jgi:HK97 gp10 family phage protein
MNKQIKDLKEDLELWVLDNTNELAEDVYDGVRERTPSNTGYAKSRWSLLETNSLNKPAQVGNDAEYINYLEDGTADTPPRNMVKATLNELENKR